MAGLLHALRGLRAGQARSRTRWACRCSCTPTIPAAWPSRRLHQGRRGGRGRGRHGHLVHGAAAPRSRPPRSLVAIFQGTERDTGLDLTLLAEIARLLSPRSAPSTWPSSRAGIAGADVRVLLYQIPGGMLSNLVSQLRAAERREPLRRSAGRDAARARGPGLSRRWSRPPARSWARRPCSTCSWASATRSSRKRSRTTAGASTAARPRRSTPTWSRRPSATSSRITGRPADLLEPGFEKAKAEIGDLAAERRGRDLLRPLPARGQRVLPVAPRRQGRAHRGAAHLSRRMPPRPPPRRPPPQPRHRPSPRSPHRAARPRPGYSLWKVSSRLRGGR